MLRGGNINGSIYHPERILFYFAHNGDLGITYIDGGKLFYEVRCPDEFIFTKTDWGIRTFGSYKNGYI